METKRRLYANEVRLLISKTEKSISRDTEILSGLGRLQIPTEIKKQKTEELTMIIQNKREEVETLKIKESEIIRGGYDSEIESKTKKENKDQKTILDNNTRKRKEIKIEKENQQIKLSMSKHIKEDRTIQKDHNYYYRQFEKSKETLPAYIQANLKEMPNNKGYIWRGCWFFGDLKSEHNQPLILFEKCRGVLNIHEIDKYEHRMFEKIGKNKKTLLWRRANHNYKVR
jgi:hypothetical protein